MSVGSAPELEDLEFLGCRARILATGESTDGRLGLIDMLEIPAGHMPPLHMHRSQDEGFYVLEGEVTFYLPGSELTFGPGDFFLAPRGVPHSYRVGESAARWLVFSSPAGFEDFVAAIGALHDVDPERLTEIADEHGLDILGPPGALPTG